VKRRGQVQEPFWLDLLRDWLRALQATFDAELRAGRLQLDAQLGNASFHEDVAEEAKLALKLLCSAGERVDCTRVRPLSPAAGRPHLTLPIAGPQRAPGGRARPGEQRRLPQLPDRLGQPGPDDVPRVAGGHEPQAARLGLLGQLHQRRGDPG